MTNKGSFKIAVYCLFFLGLAFSWSCQTENESSQPNSIEEKPDREDRRAKNEEKKQNKEDRKAKNEEEKQNKEDRRAKNEEEKPDREEKEKQDSADELDVDVDISVDIVEAEKTESSEEAKSNITNNSVLILNIDKDNPDIDDYELWECQKTDSVFSYFLNKNPDAIDDEGTSTERKRVCELFKINTVKNDDSDINLIHWAHYQKDFCEKKLTEYLTLKEEGGFNCKKIEDISFLFNEE